MRILTLDTVYALTLRQVYAAQPELADRQLADQQRVLGEACLNSADYWDPHFRALGHDHAYYIVNNPAAQTRWCYENGEVDLLRRCADSYQFAELRLHLNDERPWVTEIAAAQVRHFRPDILICRDLNILAEEFLAPLRPYFGVAVAEHATKLPAHSVRGFDLIMSALPSLVAQLRQSGIASTLVRLGFDDRAIPRLATRPKRHDVVFIGQVSRDHMVRADTLAALARHFEIEMWGNRFIAPQRESEFRFRFHEPVWGLEMLQTLRDARIVLNVHVDAAGPHAANLRLYEATGVGSLLLTDWKDDLHEMFRVGEEVVAYRSVEECVQWVRRLLADEAEREQIAAAGQARTLADHTFARRVAVMCELFEELLRGRAGRGVDVSN